MILNVRIYHELGIYFPPTSPNGASLHSFPYSRLLLFGEQAEDPGDGTRCVWSRINMLSVIPTQACFTGSLWNTAGLTRCEGYQSVNCRQASAPCLQQAAMPACDSSNCPHLGMLSAVVQGGGHGRVGFCWCVLTESLEQVLQLVLGSILAFPIKHWMSWSCLFRDSKTESIAHFTMGRETLPLGSNAVSKALGHKMGYWTCVLPPSQPFPPVSNTTVFSAQLTPGVFPPHLRCCSNCSWLRSGLRNCDRT